MKKKSKVKPEPVKKEALKKFSKGTVLNVDRLRTTATQKVHVQRKEKKFLKALETTARAEILKTESEGQLEALPGLKTSDISQKDIKSSVDITAATKIFNLDLQFGPYKFRYSRDGRYLVLGGGKGQLAAFDWVTKKLLFDINVQESIHDVTFLHSKEMVVAAQKDWTYIYDDHGMELHCLKKISRVTKLEFLPYHFLLNCLSDRGYLKWLDISIGEEIMGHYVADKGHITALKVNPANGMSCLGNVNGIVSMWSPNADKAAISFMCNKSPIQSLAIDQSGHYMGVASSNRMVSMWDLRQLGTQVTSYKVEMVPKHIDFSQRNHLAVAQQRYVEVFKDVTVQDKCDLYMKHAFMDNIEQVQFCPFEDVLGCSTRRQFSSCLIPGSGEPNYDALEVNPFASRIGSQEKEVKMLLEKIPHDLITLDPTKVLQVDVKLLGDRRKELHAQKPWVKAGEVDVRPRAKSILPPSLQEKRWDERVDMLHEPRELKREELRSKRQKAYEDIKQSKKGLGVLGRFIGPMNGVEKRFGKNSRKK